MILGGQTFTIANRTQSSQDGMGDPVYTWVVVIQPGCSLQEHHTSRDINVTDVIQARFRLFAPATAPLTNTSVVIDGTVTLDGNGDPVTGTNGYPQTTGITYLVNGEPAHWADRTGRVNHIECYLEQQEG